MQRLRRVFCLSIRARLPTTNGRRRTVIRPLIEFSPELKFLLYKAFGLGYFQARRFGFLVVSGVVTALATIHCERQIKEFTEAARQLPSHRHLANRQVARSPLRKARRLCGFLAMAQAGFFFYPGDWHKDTRVLTLQCRGAWIDLLGELWEHGGSVSWFVSDYARFWGCDSVEAMTILSQLGFYKTANVLCDCKTEGRSGVVICPAFVRPFSGGASLICHGIVTVLSRRASRELKARESDRLRKKAERDRRNVTRKSRSKSRSNPAPLLNPSPSPSLLLSIEENHKNDSLSSTLSTSVTQNGKKAPEISVKELVEDWNDWFDKKLPKVTLPLNRTREARTRLRLKEHPTLEFWTRVFKNIAKTPFLLGTAPSKSHEHWRCTFDFLIVNDTNVLKIYEGNYEHGKDGKN